MNKDRFGEILFKLQELQGNKKVKKSNVESSITKKPFVFEGWKTEVMSASELMYRYAHDSYNNYSSLAIAEFIVQLGGIGKTAEELGARPKQIINWINRGRVPFEFAKKIHLNYSDVDVTAFISLESLKKFKELNIKITG